MDNFLLTAKNVSKSYAKHEALKDVSLQISEGNIFGLLGPNGAGKTTFIRIITQIIGADTGEVFFQEEKLSRKHIAKIGYLPEERGLYKKMKVGEQLLYLAQLKGLSRKDALEKLKAWFIKFDIKTWWDKQVGDLSKGMQQKIQFIATVVHNPSLIILDEPFTGFDPINANLIKDEILSLKAQGATIIFSTHRMESVEELCDSIALIHQSRKVLDGRTRDIKNQFKTNTFEVEYEGKILNLNGDFNILDTRVIENDLHISTIQGLNSAFTANQLLNELVFQVEIKSFKEKIPSMNDIFIRTVNQN